MRARFAPPPRLGLVQWADLHRVLSSSSAEPGPWRTSRVPYFREILNAIADPDVEELVVMKAAQVGATEALILTALGYFVDQDPGPMLVVQPSEGDAEKFSKLKLAPMIAATPRLRARFPQARARTTDSTILTKAFAGGFLVLTGATSPKGLRSTSARIAFLDEVDAYPPSAGPEGDPVDLVSERLSTFWNRKLILISTPTIKGASRIEKAFGESDQRLYHVPCPHCDYGQVLRWGTPETDYGIKWDEGKPETAAYLCAHCHALIDEREKTRMVAAGEWIAQKPGARVPGWHLPALVSPFPGARWSKLVSKFLRAKGDPERLQVWVNTTVAETWEERDAKFDPEDLAARAEKYGAEVPAGAGLLTFGVDVQGDRLELLVRGWGAGEESWAVLHERIHGDPEKGETWARLEALLVRAYRHESGAELRIFAGMIDTRYLGDTVYAFVRPRQGRNVWAAHGVEALGREPLQRATKANRYNVKPFTIGTVAFKDILFRRLSLERSGPRYVHYPTPTPAGGFDAEFFAQLGAERLVREGGRRVYKQVRDRNEAIDLEVLNLAALHALGLGVRENLGKLAEELRTAAAEGRTPRPVLRRGRGRRILSRGVT